MDSVLLKPNTYLVVSLKVSRPRARISFEAGADRAIQVYLLDQAGLDEFESGQTFIGTLAGHGRTSRTRGSRVLSRGTYYLLLSNPHRVSVAAYYELW